MPSPAAGGARGGNVGLAEPLLVNRDGAGEVGAKDKYWVPADEKEMLAAHECGGEDGRPLLYRTFKVKGILLHPYRCVRLVLYFFFLIFWRARSIYVLLLEVRTDASSCVQCAFSRVAE